MVRIMHLADLHLGWKPSFLDDQQQRELQKERDSILTQTVNYALANKQGTDLVIIAGDLFETHRPPRDLVEQVIKELMRLKEAGIEVVTVPGNHDEITYHDSVYRIEQDRWPGILVTNPVPQLIKIVTIKGINCYLYSLAYTGGITRTSPPLAEFPKEEGEGIHLAVFHGSYNWDAGERSLPLAAGSLKKAGYHYVALGHLHRYQSFKLEKGLAVYPGAAAGKGFSDPGEGSFLVVDFQGTEPHVERIPLETRKYQVETVDISQVEGQEELEKLLLNFADPKSLVQVHLKGLIGFPLDLRILQERIKSQFYYLELIDESVYFSQTALTHLAQEPTITGFFLRRMQLKLEETEDSREIELVNRALTNGLLALKGGKN